MRSGTSFFNGTVWKKTFLRFWPIWAANLVIWLLALPLDGLMVLQSQLRNGGSAFLYFSEDVGTYGRQIAVVCAVIFGLLAAMAVCSHLYSARSANFMGALPIRREGLFLSHYLSGLTMLLAPNAVMFLLTLLVEIFGGAVEWVPLLFWLAALSGAEFFFYSFAVCLGMFTGHLLALPVFYGIFNVLAGAVYFLWNWVMTKFYYGYCPVSRMEALTTWLMPVLRLAERLEGDAVYTQASAYGSTLRIDHYEVTGLSDLGIYALAGVVLTVVALLLYRKRHLETAGDVVAVKVMRPVFKYGVAVCSGLFFGFATNGILSTGELGLIIAIVLWGIVGYFVAQMLLDKSFRVFHKWKGAAAVTAAFLVLFLVVGFDLTGYETRVPDPSQVASVEISGLRSAPYDDGSYMRGLVVDDPETVSLAVALHQAAVDQREPKANGGESDWMGVTLSYRLSDGTVLERKYGITAYQNDSGQPGTTAWAVENLLADRDLVWQAYGFDEAEAAGQLNSAYYVGDQTAVSAERDEMAVITEAASGTGKEYREAMFYDADAAALLEAVKADFADGTIGVRQLWADDGENARLEFNWIQTVITSDGDTETEMTDSVTIAVPDTALRTTALLEELGAR